MHRDRVEFDIPKLSRKTALNGLLRGEVAKRSQISRASVADAYQGRPIGVRTARAIAKTLGCTIADLVAEEKPLADVAA